MLIPRISGEVPQKIVIHKAETQTALLAAALYRNQVITEEDWQGTIHGSIESGIERWIKNQLPMFGSPWRFTFSDDADETGHIDKNAVFPDGARVAGWTISVGSSGQVCCQKPAEAMEAIAPGAGASLFGILNKVCSELLCAYTFHEGEAQLQMDEENYSEEEWKEMEEHGEDPLREDTWREGLPSWIMHYVWDAGPIKQVCEKLSDSDDEFEGLIWRIASGLLNLGIAWEALDSRVKSVSMIRELDTENDFYPGLLLRWNDFDNLGRLFDGHCDLLMQGGCTDTQWSWAFDLDDDDDADEAVQVMILVMNVLIHLNGVFYEMRQWLGGNLATIYTHQEVTA